MTTPVPAAARKPAVPLPTGAARMSKTWVDAKGLPHVTLFAVPVDANDYRTAHVRYRCRGHVDVTGGDGQVRRQPCDVDRWVLPGDKPGFCPDHGCELGSDDRVSTPALPLADIWRQAERSTRPLWALVAEAGIGAALHAGDVSAMAPAALTPALAFAAHRVVRRRLVKRATKPRATGGARMEEGQTSGRVVETIERRARLAAYLGAASGAWLTAAATVDPASLVGKVVWASLPLWWAVGAAPWWARVEAQRNAPKPTQPVAPDAVEPSDDEKAAAEAARMWAEGGVAANTRLDTATWRRIPCGWQAEVAATKRGALNSLGGDNMKTIRKVAAAFGTPRSAVTWIEEYDEDPNRGLVLIQPNNPLKDPQLWAGPASIQITRSRIEADVGRMIDGTPMVEHLYRFGWGAPGGLTIGSTGSGKSERLRLRLLLERWASFEDPATGQRKGLFLSFLHDPKRLESFAEFRNAIHGYGITRDDAHIMIDAMLREMIRRYEMLSASKWIDGKKRRRRGAVKWNPLVHGPLIHVIWDEFHELAGDKAFVEKLEKLARYQRACGMGATLASHMGTIGDTGSQALRDMVAGGRATLLRTTSGLNAALATGGQLTADPRGLPRQPGMCLVADGESATLMARHAYVEGDEARAERTLYDWLFDDDNNPIGFPAEIPPETAEAFGPEFMEWMAAGQSARGRDGWVYKAAPPQVSAEDGSAKDGLFQILLLADRPLSRKEIGENAAWRWSVTQTLTNAINAGLEAAPPWLLRSKDGKNVFFTLAPAAREQAAAAVEELREEVNEG